MALKHIADSLHIIPPLSCVSLLYRSTFIKSRHFCQCEFIYLYGYIKFFSKKEEEAFQYLNSVEIRPYIPPENPDAIF